MQILKIEALENGAHRNQSYNGVLPDGWALIPEGMELENFPFGEVSAEEINGVMTVTSWTPGVMPEPEPEPAQPNDPIADLEELVVDHEYRLTLMELGVN